MKESYENYLSDKFLYLIAIEGEDNQNQAETILKRLLEQENYALMHQLISTQKSMRDAAGRCFKSMSAVGYAFWAGDTRMSRMLEKYINVLEEKGYETKQKLFYECQHIEEQGIEFTFDGERIEHSKHFDWQPLIAAYNAYIAAVNDLLGRNDGHGEWRDGPWAPVEILWLNIGKELAKVPTHVAQEYCSGMLFHPLLKFMKELNDPTLKRKVKFYNPQTGKMESWFIRGIVNPNLGKSFSICKNGGALAIVFSMFHRSPARPTVLLPADDLAAINPLFEMRIFNDRKQTLENLQPLVPSSEFHP